MSLTKERASHILRADIRSTFAGRMIGLMFRKAYPADCDGVAFIPCKGVHSFFMRFPIDLVFFDGAFTVTRIVSSFAPWRMSPWRQEAQGCLELPAETAARRNIQVGDKLVLK